VLLLLLLPPLLPGQQATLLTELTTGLDCCIRKLLHAATPATGI
jgi:hypothetical protein